MSWQGEIITIVRHLVNDLNPDSYTYTYERLEQAILVSAQILKQEITLNTTYSIDVDTRTLSPDPSNPRDDAFINLVALKTACLILSSEVKTYSLMNVAVQDGPASINMGGIVKDLQALYKQACETYEEYKLNYVMGINSAGKAILSPYSPGSNFTRYSR